MPLPLPEPDPIVTLRRLRDVAASVSVAPNPLDVGGGVPDLTEDLNEDGLREVLTQLCGAHQQLVRARATLSATLSATRAMQAVEGHAL